MARINEKAIFLEAIEIADVAERAAFLADQCAGAPQVQAAVQALLDAHEEPDNPARSATPGNSKIQRG